MRDDALGEVMVARGALAAQAEEGGHPRAGGCAVWARISDLGQV